MWTKKLKDTDIRDTWWDSHIAVEDDSYAWQTQRQLEKQSRKITYPDMDLRRFMITAVRDE